jgi:hypothetical protein|tara:strand:- start:134 stop:364 length:231 start_codon:yes stop_codon:yes gene_type:complete
MDISLKIPEELKIQSADSKKIIEINAKLEALKLVADLIDNFRESYTRQLVISGINDEEKLENKLDSLEVTEKNITE